MHNPGSPPAKVCVTPKTGANAGRPPHTHKSPHTCPLHQGIMHLPVSVANGARVGEVWMGWIGLWILVLIWGIENGEVPNGAARSGGLGGYGGGVVRQG